MRLECMVWGALTLLLFGAEVLLPGAFMLWMGLAAAVVFLIVLVVPDMSLLLQIGAFVVLSFAAMQVYRICFRGRGRGSDQPLLNRRAEQLIGRWVTLDQPIQGGRGRAKVDDAFWVVGGPDLPAGSAVRIVGVDGMMLLVQAE